MTQRMSFKHDDDELPVKDLPLKSISDMQAELDATDPVTASDPVGGPTPAPVDPVAVGDAPAPAIVARWFTVTMPHNPVPGLVKIEAMSDLPSHEWRTLVKAEFYKQRGIFSSQSEPEIEDAKSPA